MRVLLSAGTRRRRSLNRRRLDDVFDASIGLRGRPRRGGEPPGVQPGRAGACLRAGRRRGWRRPGSRSTCDDARELFGRLRGERPELPEVWTGSHLDSVPRGRQVRRGRSGVLAGFEAVARIGRRERTLARGRLPGRGDRVSGQPASSRPRTERCRARSSSCTSSRDRGCSGRCAAGGGHGDRRVRAPDGPSSRARRGTPGRRRWRRVTTLCAEAAEYVLRVRDAAAAIEGAVGTVGRSRGRARSGQRGSRAVRLYRRRARPGRS